MIVDNSKQFDSKLFRNFYQTIRTKLAFASIYHLVSNGAVERANRIIFAVI